MPEPGPHAAGGGPGFFDWIAPPHWRAIDFVSDLHLSAATPATLQAWGRYLAGCNACAIVVLGDLFEVWVGDDSLAGEFESALADTMAAAARVRTLAYMVGNRDFLAGAGLRQRCGMAHLPDPTLLQAFGRRVVLTHGDALCLADHDYQAFRRQVRESAWQDTFLRRPLAERRAIAADIRRQSTMRRQFDGSADADLDPATTLAWLAAADAATMIHGHTHRPADHRPAAGLVRHVLSDWDLDDPQRPRAEVLRLTPDGIQRLSPAAASR